MSSEENQFNVQGYNIVTILKRLEAATSRLEDITVFQEETNKHKSQQQSNLLKSSVNEDKQIEGDGLVGSSVGNESLQSTSIDPSVAPPQSQQQHQQSQSQQQQQQQKSQLSSKEVSKSVAAFEQFVHEYVHPFVETSIQIDSLVGESAQLFGEAFSDQDHFLQLVSQCQKPDMTGPAFVKVFTPMNEKITQITTLKDDNRKSTYFNHLNSLSESAAIFYWIGSTTPVSYISDTRDSAKFWLDRVLKDFKGKDKIHVDWVNQVLKIFDELKIYVKEFHATGPSWNSKGKSFDEAVESTQDTQTVSESGGDNSQSAPSAPPIPPAPPAPPASIFESSSDTAAGDGSGGSNNSSGSSQGGLNAVFAQLNKGSAITSGLKKVEKSEMTHKNPELRKQPPVAPKKPKNLSQSATAITTLETPSSSSPVAVKKSPKRELVDGTKWIIQNFTQNDTQTPIVIETEMHQSVFIGNCEGVTIQLKGKANAVSISETKSIGVVIDSLISGIEVIKSHKYGLQVIGLVPMISIDKSDEGHVYLSKESIEHDCQVFTSNSTALNINIPEENDDFKELVVPEQFVSVVKNGKLVSEIVEHVG